MTRFEIERLGFSPEELKAWEPLSPRNRNWPVVYVLDNAGNTSGIRGARDDVYVGESTSASSRMRQHLASPGKQHLNTVRVILDDEFNKSVCLDLESHLIRWLDGDGTFRMLNRNVGITEADYYDRDRYRATFDDVFEQLRAEGLFNQTIPQIENSDLFKLSPFKALTLDQEIAVEQILEGLFADLEADNTSTIVIQGDPGTGKTVVAIYLVKLLRDIATTPSAEDLDSDSVFSDFFTDGYRELLAGLRIGFVIPQQSLRKSVKRVFAKTPGLTADMVMNPFGVGNAAEDFDLLIVDEAHRLNQRANQPAGPLNKQFNEITERLFGSRDLSKNQLDWILARSKHQIFLLDAAQTVKPADLPPHVIAGLIERAANARRRFGLMTQMRVQAGADYVAYVRQVLNPKRAASEDPVAPQTFDGYDLRMFESLHEMRQAIEERDAEFGLSRLVAGFAWKWQSRKTKKNPNPPDFDIELEGLRLRWNSTDVDWIASPGSLQEVGSIHTVQGYDLNYAGVIIGSDLRYDLASHSLVVDRGSYFDAKGKESNAHYGKKVGDDELLGFITNIYAVLLTRGIRGTYVYVCDPALREYLKQYFPAP
jgi:DUF2075 family protein